MANTSHHNPSSNIHFPAGFSNSSDIDLHAPGNYSSANVTLLSGTLRLTVSSGVQSQTGARWSEDYVKTVNSGFAAGTPRSENRKGIREGSETGVVWMPVVNGLGRTGKAPAGVPVGLVNAMRAENRQKKAGKKQTVGREDRPHGSSVSRGQASPGQASPTERADKTPQQDGGREKKRWRKRARSYSPWSDEEAKTYPVDKSKALEQETRRLLHTEPLLFPEILKSADTSATPASSSFYDSRLNNHETCTEQNRSGSYAFIPRERTNPF